MQGVIAGFSVTVIEHDLLLLGKQILVARSIDDDLLDHLHVLKDIKNTSLGSLIRGATNLVPLEGDLIPSAPAIEITVGELLQAATSSSGQLNLIKMLLETVLGSDLGSSLLPVVHFLALERVLHEFDDPPDIAKMIETLIKLVVPMVPPTPLLSAAVQLALAGSMPDKVAPLLMDAIPIEAWGLTNDGKAAWIASQLAIKFANAEQYAVQEYSMMLISVVLDSSDLFQQIRSRKLASRCSDMNWRPLSNLSKEDRKWDKWIEEGHLQESDIDDILDAHANLTVKPIESIKTFATVVGCSAETALSLLLMMDPQRSAIKDLSAAKELAAVVMFPPDPNPSRCLFRAFKSRSVLEQLDINPDQVMGFASVLETHFDFLSSCTAATKRTILAFISHFTMHYSFGGVGTPSSQVDQPFHKLLRLSIDQTSLMTPAGDSLSLTSRVNDVLKLKLGLQDTASPWRFEEAALQTLYRFLGSQRSSELGNNEKKLFSKAFGVSLSAAAAVLFASNQDAGSKVRPFLLRDLRISEEHGDLLMVLAKGDVTNVKYIADLMD